MFPQIVKELIEQFSALPGVGDKSAKKLALFFLSQEKEQIKKFSNILLKAKNEIKRCNICNNFSEDEICKICSSEQRDNNTILVVEDILDIIAFEETNYNGKYHVLNGLLSPLKGKSPKDININNLIIRLEKKIGKLHKNKKKIIEIIFALSSSLEGESTMMFIKQKIQEKSFVDYITITEIAKGIPVNSNIDYLDPETLKKSLMNRK